MTTLNADLASILEAYDQRLHNVEQMVTGSAVMGAIGETGNEFDEVIIDGVVVDTDPPSNVTGLTATPGTFYNRNFVDVSWTEGVTGGDAVMFEIELARVTAGPTYTVLNVFTTAATSYRIDNLEPGQQYRVKVWGVNRLGIRGDMSGGPSATFTANVDSTIPPAPTGVSISRGATTAVVSWTPLTPTQAPDVANGNGLYEIQIDTANTFSTGNLKSMLAGERIVAFSGINTEGTWYARVRAIDSSGNAGTWSSTSAAATVGAVNDSMIVADLSAAKITAGTLAAARIAANTITADKLATGTLSTANITVNGGSIRINNPTTTGILINSQGIRGYKSGSTTFILDGTTGDATFKGTVDAATITGSSIVGGEFITNPGLSGQRIVLDDGVFSFSDSAYHAMRLYNARSGGENDPAWIFNQYTMINDEVAGSKASSLYLQSGKPTSGSGRAYVILKGSTTGRSEVSTIAARTRFRSGSTEFTGVFRPASGEWENPSGRGPQIYFPSEFTGGSPFQDYDDAPILISSPTGSRVSVIAGWTPAIGAAGIIVYEGNCFRFRNYNGAGHLDIYANSFQPTSTARIKRHIKRVGRDHSKSVLSALVPREYDKIFDYRYDGEPEYQKDFGLVAEEVFEILPEVVSLDEDGKPEALNYMALIPFLIDGYQELEARLTKLEKKK